MPITATTASRVTAKSFEQPARLGDQSAAIRQVEQMLHGLGYFPGKVDGFFDEHTLSALRRFKKADPQVANQGNAITSRVYSNLRDAVRKVEKDLSSLGNDPGKVDGRWTDNTTGAVKRFQRKHDMEVTGRAGEHTRKRIAKALGPDLGKPKHATGYVNGRPFGITVYPVGQGEYLRADAAKAYVQMIAAAKRAGVNLYAVSGFRTMDEQRKLYQAYLNGTGNLAARPGYSNHQGGISMDIGGVGGYGTRAYQWLKNHARRFGFVNDVSGEYWHWTYKR
ncbi:MAG: D-alanyl-D-alanine carboxypeptidase family protein [Myxococcales bacterium]|nr:D-alanyl-D-alanine carboxypeptidase family protein [Myxococcales bacterium]